MKNRHSFTIPFVCDSHGKISSGMPLLRKVCLFICIFSTALLSTNCKVEKKPNCKAEFDKSYEANVHAFMATMPEMNPQIVRKIAEYTLNKEYDIDSTFVLLKGDELQKFVEKHREILEKGCDSILNLYSDCRGLFEKYFEKNIETFISATPNADTAAARRHAECILNKLYATDSTFVVKNAEELADFIKSNIDRLTPCNNLAKRTNPVIR